MRRWRKLKSAPSLGDRFALAYFSVIVSSVFFVVIWLPLLATPLVGCSWFYPFPVELFSGVVTGMGILGFSTLDEYIVDVFAKIGSFVYKDLGVLVVGLLNLDS